MSYSCSRAIPLCTESRPLSAARRRVIPAGAAPRWISAPPRPPGSAPSRTPFPDHLRDLTVEHPFLIVLVVDIQHLLPGIYRRRDESGGIVGIAVIQAENMDKGLILR